MVLLSDFNVHNQSWLNSKCTDADGVEAEEMCDMFGLSQLVHFPTRGKNTLDLVMSSTPGSATPVEPMGSSDHKPVRIVLQVGSQPPPTPRVQSVYDWASAPWSHMNGALKWDPRKFGSTNQAEAALNRIFKSVLDRCVRLKKVGAKLPAPWWNYTCAKELRYKCRMFQLLEAGKVSHEQYLMAVRVCRKVQKRAYARFQLQLRTKVGTMGNSDKNFWSLAKDLAGLSQERSSSCPSVDVLADHFADKMSNSESVDASSGSVSTRPPVSLKCWKVRYKQVLRTLQSLDVSKSANGVGPRFFKGCAVVIAPAVTRLFRLIVSRACFPARWKIGRVSPLHKRSSVSEAKNYRPVTVLDNLPTNF